VTTIHKKRPRTPRVKYKGMLVDKEPGKSRFEHDYAHAVRHGPDVPTPKFKREEP
jgi:hypothetical protein